MGPREQTNETVDLDATIRLNAVPKEPTPTTSSSNAATAVLWIRPRKYNAGDRDDHTVQLSAITDTGINPVFVDGTGRRRKRFKLAALALGGVCLAYAVLVGIGLAGGATGQQAFLPLPGLRADHSATPSTSPSVVHPSSSTSSRRPTVTSTPTFKISRTPTAKATTQQSPTTQATTTRPAQPTTQPPPTTQQPQSPPASGGTP